jgi:hypothetical protein
MRLQIPKIKPSAQTELDIFPNWTYKIPIENTASGQAKQFLSKPGFFNRAELVFGDLKAFKTLEMGPNEGEITFHLHHHGIKNVVSIEARPANYLKCVVIKNMLRLDNVRFMCGDAILHLEDNSYDICYCKGVFYHLSDLELFFENITKSVKRIVFQTHYYDTEAEIYDKHNIESREKSSLGGFPTVNWDFGDSEIFHMRNESFQRIKHYYQDSDGHRIHGRGGIENFAYMMPLKDIIKAFNLFGWKIEDIEDNPDNNRGPWVSFLAHNKNL